MKQHILLKTFLILLILVTLTSKSRAQQSYIYRFKIGHFEIIALSDGTVPLDVNRLFQDNDSVKIDTLLKSAYVTNPVETSINAYLIIMGNKLFWLILEPVNFLVHHMAGNWYAVYKLQDTSLNKLWIFYQHTFTTTIRAV